jgi:cell wall assembly regulator SMI1
MRRTPVIRIASIAAIVVVILVALPVIVLRTIGSALLSSAMDMYPEAPAMPPVVSDTMDDLLARFEAVLTQHAPNVLAAMQPGLSDGQIDALESQYAFKLPPDLRALYRWRNGTAPNSTLDAFPNHRFVPLDEACTARDVLRQQVRGTTVTQQRAYATFAGHRDAWLGLIVDAAGDGYFFDQNRTESRGSFFFCFLEDGSYEFYPAFRNYLAAVVAGHKAGVFRFGSQGAETADFYKAQTIWDRYGASGAR